MKEGEVILFGGIIKDGTGVDVGRWFADNIGREVGEGTHTLFWWDPWIDGIVLKCSSTDFLI